MYSIVKHVPYIHVLSGIYVKKLPAVKKSHLPTGKHGSFPLPYTGECPHHPSGSPRTPLGATWTQVALKVMDAVDEEALQLRRSEFEVLRTVPSKLGDVAGDGREGSGWIFCWFLLDPLGFF